MAAVRSIEIICSACSADTIIRREPKYEGFKKVGELFICSACGHQYENEVDVPFKQKRQIKVFSEADKSKTVDVFKDDPKGRNCRYCRNYIINPFTQICGLSFKKVQATDSCPDFERKKDE